MVVKRIASDLIALAEEKTSSLAQFFSEETYRIALTGLSQSGKSMLFTALISLLNARSKPEKLHTLPLLSCIPVDEVKRFELRAMEGHVAFPIKDALIRLQNQQWPQPTEQIYGFELVLELSSRHMWDKFLESCGGRRKIIFQFYDYPGEWLTDLPMLSQTYVQWAQQVNTQMAFEPHRTLSDSWVGYIERFDFESPPTPERVREITDVYRSYLTAAKSQGLSLIQPSGMLLKTTAFDWDTQGFVPLPSKVFSDLAHPWLEVMNTHYLAYQADWLEPLYKKYFKGFDRQIILVDVLSAAEAGLEYLQQLKEALTQLADIFVQMQQSWWEKYLSLGASEQTRVAFVATKVDLLPEHLHENLLSLLKEVTKGAQAKYSEEAAHFDHFVISAIQATQPESDGLLYWATPEQVRKRTVPCFPKSFKDYSDAPCDYQVIPCLPPRNAVNQLVHARNLDRILEYMLSRIKEPENAK